MLVLLADFIFLNLFKLKDGKRTLKCWLSFYYSSRILGHLVVTLSPLFIFRNHLAEPALIKVEDSQDNKEVLDTLVNGKGKEIQVSLLVITILRFL